MNALPSAVRLQITRVPYRHDFDPSEHARETSDFCGEDAVLIEYGAGAAVKTEILINAFRSPRLYVPVDIAGDFLQLVLGMGKLTRLSGHGYSILLGRHAMRSIISTLAACR